MIASLVTNGVGIISSVLGVIENKGFVNKSYDDSTTVISGFFHFNQATQPTRPARIARPTKVMVPWLRLSVMINWFNAPTVKK